MGLGIPNTWLFVTPYLGSRDGACALRQKTLYNEEAHQQTIPLIISAAPEGCTVKRQFRVGDSKYAVISDPYLQVT